ncbi:uncharacterized serine-rich protein C215.13-like [Tetranychus urticae]|uniref:Uncharacterized protein n=1 Tax=Tetranychus urticae TaxID=32264 RepID=T1JQ27_TETUR|nr:uncharacterized serine-rich protein C215.13-like [Tetranychus urticae]
MRFISSSYIILALDGFGFIHGKGLAVIGGKGNREVCPDCPDNYNAEELTWALVTLAIVTGLFLSICFCRFYPKIRQLFTSNGEGVTKSCHCKSTLHRGSINPPTSMITPITMMNSTGQGSLASQSTGNTMVSNSTSKSSSLTKQSSTEINANLCLTKNNANNRTLNGFNHSINDNFNSTNATKLSNNDSLMSNPKGSRISVSYSTPMDPFNSEPTTSLRSISSSTSASHASASTIVPSSASSHTSLSSSNHLQYHQQHHNPHHAHQQQQHNHSHRSSLKSTIAPANSSTCQLMCPQVVSITTTTTPAIINDQSTVYTSHI